MPTAQRGRTRFRFERSERLEMACLRLSMLAALLSAARPSLVRPPLAAGALRFNSVRPSTRARARMEAVAEAADTVAADSEAADGEPAVRKRVLSGVQPTGVLHLGNYLGAIRQWVANQELYDNYFCVVDLHAITAPHVPKELTKDSYRTAALYLASGIDPARSKIFIQSHVTAHAELQWLLNCATPMGWLEKMIQYKEKAQKQVRRVCLCVFVRVVDTLLALLKPPLT
jgi:hypothetical protein